MDLMRILLSRCTALFRKQELDEDLDEELDTHIDFAVEENLKRGMSEQEARTKALREFGGVTQVKETYRLQRGLPFMETFVQDIRYAIRQLSKSPGFTMVAIVTLALGIGANAAVFSVVEAVLLRPLPYAESGRLVDVQSITRNLPSSEHNSLSYPDFFDWRAQNYTLEHLVSYHDSSYTLTGLDRPVHVDAEVVSWDLLATLGVTPEIGRGFVRSEEKRGTKVALISHKLWVSQFNGNKSIIGQPIELNGDLFTVIGVMPATFRFPVTEPQNGIWTTLAVDDSPTDQNPPIEDRNNHFLNGIGRMKSGVTVAEVSQDLDAIARNLVKQYPNSNTLHNAAKAQTELTSLLGDMRTELLVVQGAVGLVLLIACGNIANLLLARMRERQREIAMRNALGAGRARIVRQLLIESLVLSAAGGLTGCILAFACTPLILSLIGNSIPRAANAGVSLPVLAFAICVSLATGLIFGAIPAVTTSKIDLASSLKEGGRSEVSAHNWLRSSLIVSRVALGLVVATGAGLLVASFINLRRTNEGFNSDHVLTFFFDLPDSRFKDTRQEFYRRYFDRLRTLPGVRSAAGVMILPMNHDSATTSFEDPEHPVPEAQQPDVDVNLVTPEYFSTMQIPVLKGRAFSDQDDKKTPKVMIVNEAFARKYFPGREILGKVLKPGGPQLREIVGIVGDIRLEATQSGARPSMYIPAAQWKDNCCLYTVMRTSVAPLSLEPTVQQVVASMDQDTPIVQVHTMQDLTDAELSQPRFAMVLLSVFAGLAIVLSIVGLYGVMMYSVSRRTREIGVRMALGAQRSRVLNTILREAAALLGAGIAIGLAVSLLSASVLKSMLYGTGSRNPAVLILVSIAVAIAGLIAAFIPARRAASVDPMQALRTE